MILESKHLCNGDTQFVLYTQATRGRPHDDTQVIQTTCRTQRPQFPTVLTRERNNVDLYQSDNDQKKSKFTKEKFCFFFLYKFTLGAGNYWDLFVLVKIKE